MRRMAGDVGERLVAHDPAARDVLGLRLGLAPRGERLEAAEHVRVAARRADAVPGDLEVVGVVGRIGELLHLGVEPHAAAGLDQLLEHAREDLGEVGDVADRVFDLPLGQRAAAPVGEARALVDRLAEPGFDQVGIADLLGLADRHHRDLGVEDRVRGLAGQVVDDLDVLPAGVEDLEHVLVVAEQLEHRGQVDPVGERIDRRGFLLVAELHQAQQRVDRCSRA